MNPKSLVHAKKLDEAFVYSIQKDKNDKGVISLIMQANRIDKKDPTFEGVISDIRRRQISSVLLDLFMRSDVIPLMGAMAAPIAFMVFHAKDIKDSMQKPRIFIELSSVIKYEDGHYKVSNINNLIALLMNMANTYAYYRVPDKIVSNANLNQSGTTMYTYLFTYVLDYLRMAGYQQHTGAIRYMTAIFYQVCVLQKTLSDSTRALAMRVADITRSEANKYDMLMTEEMFENIDSYIQNLANIFHFRDLTTGVFVEKWMYLFGPGTQFAIELFPHFATMLSNVYAGTYINNAKQIEKCAGRARIATFSNEVLNITKSALSRDSK